MEYCGGGLGIDVYQYAGTTSVTMSTLSTYKDWTSTGCFVDSVDSRVLPVPMGINGLTVESCLDACSSAGYEFGGVEYGQECYCGRTAPTTLATDGRCSMKCAGKLSLLFVLSDLAYTASPVGNDSEYCGGSNGINVYQSGNVAQQPQNLATYNNWRYMNCYVDSIDSRSLPFVPALDGSHMTVEMCLDSCESNGYLFAGLEYSGECYCGDRISSAVATDGRCSMLCNGTYLFQSSP